MYDHILSVKEITNHLNYTAQENRKLSKEIPNSRYEVNILLLLLLKI